MNTYKNISVHIQHVTVIETAYLVQPQVVLDMAWSGDVLTVQYRGVVHCVWGGDNTHTNGYTVKDVVGTHN